MTGATQLALKPLSRAIIVDPQGRPVAQMPAHVFDGNVEILRGDLAEILHEAT